MITASPSEPLTPRTTTAKASSSSMGSLPARSTTVCPGAGRSRTMGGSPTMEGLDTTTWPSRVRTWTRARSLRPAGVTSAPTIPLRATSAARAAACSAATSVNVASSWRRCSTTNATAEMARMKATTTVAARAARTRTPPSRSRRDVPRPRAGWSRGRTAASATPGHQPVPHAADGLDGVLAVRLVDLAPQVADVDLDDVVVALVVGVPYRLEDVGLGHHVPAMAQEEVQQPELPGRQGDLALPSAHRAARRVEGQVAGSEDGRSRGSATADQRPQPRDQHQEGERLGEVVISAEVPRVGLVVLAVLGRQQQYRRPDTRRPHLPAHLVPVEPRQHDVQNDDVVGLYLGVEQSLGSVVDHVDDESLGRQSPPDVLGQPDFVVNQQHPHHAHPPSGPVCSSVPGARLRTVSPVALTSGC